MHHAMLDHFAARNTAAHRLDPVGKTLGGLVLIFATVLVGREHFLPLVPVAISLAAYHAVGRVPVGYTIRRLLVVSPFALGVVVLFPFFEGGPAAATFTFGGWTVRISEPGLLRAGHLLSKFILCAWSTLLLLATTRFDAIVRGLSRMRVPRAFVMQLAFLYRYLWLLIDEAMRLRRARAARDGGLGPWRLRFRSRAAVVGVLFVRTYDRAERIYWAMSARGFHGALPAIASERMRLKDALFLAAVLLLGAGILVGDRLAYG